MAALPQAFRLALELARAPALAQAMRRRLPGPRLFGLALVLLLSALLAWEIVAAAAASRLAATRPEAALWWRPADSRALVETAERRFVAAEDAAGRADAGRLAAAALRANPLEARALRLLALLAEKEGNAPRALALMELAAGRSLRDPLVHGWLFEHRLRDGRYPAALAHLDLLLRTQPQLRGDILPVLMTLATDGRSAAAVVEMLHADPPWRAWFLGEFSRRAADPLAPASLYAALQAGPRPPREAELRPHLERLVAAGRFEQAFLLWQGSLAGARRDDPAYLHNGDFRHPPSNLAFDWVLSRVAGATVAVVLAPGGDGNALRIEFTSGRVAFRHVGKLALLPPGRYRLSGRVMTRALDNPRGLQWRLYCADARDRLLAETGRVTGTTAGWVEFAEEFTVPADGCRAQWLRLELAARVVLEQQVGGGTAWYQDLRIVRAGMAAARP